MALGLCMAHFQASRCTLPFVLFIGNSVFGWFLVLFPNGTLSCTSGRPITTPDLLRAIDLLTFRHLPALLLLAKTFDKSFCIFTFSVARTSKESRIGLRKNSPEFLRILKEVSRRKVFEAVVMGSDGMDVGFLGLGIMGIAMARNLLKKGFKVTVWNRSPAKCEELAKEGALIGSSPADVIARCPITIAMLADPSVAFSVALGPGGVVEGITPGKGYVDMSTVDPATSQKIAEAIGAKGGEFLEAPVSGSKQPAETATLIILAAGNKSLFERVKPAFDAMGKKSFYLNDVGGGAKMKLVVNMIMGSMMASLSEGLAVADKAGLSQQTLLEVLELGSTGNPMFKLKGPTMIEGKFATSFPLKHQQKDMRLALALGDEVAQAMPVAAAANETYKKARGMGLGDQDFSAVYQTLAQEATDVPDSAKSAS